LADQDFIRNFSPDINGDETMKRTIFFLLMGLLILDSYGQKAINVAEATREMSRGLQPAMVVNIPEARLADVEKAWVRYQQKGTRSRVQKDKQEMRISGAAIEGVQGGNLTLYSLLYADKEEVLLFAFLDIDSVFFLPERDAAMARSLQTYLRGFAVQSYQEVASGQLRQEEKKLQALEKQLESLRSEEKKNDRLARENEREVRNIEDDIREKTADEERKARDIELQKDKVDALKEFPEEKALEEKALKALKKEKKKIQSQREGLYRKKDKLEAGIKRADRDARIAREKQKLQDREILRQQESVKRAKDKLEGIR